MWNFFILYCFYIQFIAQAQHTILYSENVAYEGSFATRSLSTSYCKGLSLFSQFNTQTARALLFYNEDGFGVTGTLLSQTVRGPYGHLLFHNFTDFLQGKDPLISFREAGVVNDDFWVGNVNGKNCENWRGNEFCAQTFVKNPDEYTQNIPSHCSATHRVVCMALNAQYITFHPTYSPTTSPTTSVPTFQPSHVPTDSPTTSSPSMEPSVNPSTTPSTIPSMVPTTPLPSTSPSSTPSTVPSTIPSMAPTPLLMGWVQVDTKHSVSTSFYYFGRECKMSTDGNVITTISHNNVLVWNQSDPLSGWVQLPFNVGGYGSSTNHYLATSDDGRTIAVCTSGEVKVYSRVNEDWVQDSFESDDYFYAYAVALSGDAQTLAIGNPNSANAVNMYRKINETWVTITTLTPNSGTYGGFGRSLSLTTNGTKLAVGGIFGRLYNQSIWMYMYENETWSLQQNVFVLNNVSMNTRNRYSSLMLSGDGSTFAVGLANDEIFGDFDDPYGSGQVYTYPTIGSVFIFVQSPEQVWEQQGSKLVGNWTLRDYAYNGANFGIKLTLSNNGNALAMSRVVDEYGKGGVWMFLREDGIWAQVGEKLVATDSYTDARQASCLSFNGNGTRLAMGAMHDSNSYGSLWQFAYVDLNLPTPGPTLRPTSQAPTRSPTVSAPTASPTLSAPTTSPSFPTPRPTTWTPTASPTIAFTQEQRLIMGGGLSTTVLIGSSISLSADGTYAAVGGELDNDPNIGAVWILIRSGNTWNVQQKLVGSGNIGISYQGASVSLSADGMYVLIGGPTDNNNIGAAWVFIRSGVSWSQQAKLPVTGYSGQPSIGCSVALSGDGVIAVVGGSQDTFVGSGGVGGTVGAAWVYLRTGSSWSYTQKLVGTGMLARNYAWQGFSVAISSDGFTILMGGPLDGVDRDTGAAWVFTRSGQLWTQQTKLVPSDTPGSRRMGGSVALSGNGNMAAMAGQGLNTMVYIFKRVATTWSLNANITVPSTPYNTLNVALSTDGSTLVVGEPSASDSNYISGIGRVFVFSNNGVAWTQLGAQIVGTGYTVGNYKVLQGTSVAVTSNGSRIAFGGKNDNNLYGTAWVFRKN